MKIKLKDVLQRELKSRNESIQKLAKKCKIPKTTLTDWSQGVLPSAKNIHHLKTLSDYFDVSLSTLLFNIKDERSSTDVLFSSTFVDDGKRYRLIIEKLPK